MDFLRNVPCAFDVYQVNQLICQNHEEDFFQILCVSQKVRTLTEATSSNLKNSRSQTSSGKAGPCKNNPPSERISTHCVKVHLHSSGGNLWKDALECMCCSELWKVCGINKWKQVRFMYGAYILHCEHFLYIECCLGFPFFKSGSYFSNSFKTTDYLIDYILN